LDAQEAADIVASWPSVARCAPDEIPTDQWACDHSNEFRRHYHDGSLGNDLEPEAPAAAAAPAAAFIQTQYRPPIKCKEPVYGNPVSCDLDDITDANDDHVKDIWNMTPVKVVEGGVTVSNEPAKEPVDEADKGKTAAAKGSAKASPEKVD